jgi:hypothetical protein
MYGNVKVGRLSCAELGHVGYPRQSAAVGRTCSMRAEKPRAQGSQTAWSTGYQIAVRVLYVQRKSCRSLRGVTSGDGARLIRYPLLFSALDQTGTGDSEGVADSVKQRKSEGQAG